MKNLILLIVALFLSLPSLSEESKHKSNFSIQAMTTFPTVVGADINYHLNQQFVLGIGAGVIPQPYYSFIGQMAAQYGGNSAYKDVIEAAFQNNSMLKVTSQYNFSGDYKKIGIGAVFSQLKSSGVAGIDKVLTASNGKDYSNLKNLLVAAGRDPNVDINSTLIIAEVYASYRFADYKNFYFEGQVGVAKVVSADINFKSGLQNFEATAVGNNLMRSSESETESIVTQYGLTPTIGIKTVYLF